MSPAAEGSSGRVQSVDRAVALLHAVAAGGTGGQTVAALAAACELNRATAWRLLATLEAHGFVEREPTHNRYTLGFTLARLATFAGTDGLVRAAHGVLEHVCEVTGETAALAVVRQLTLTYVDEVTAPAVLSARWLGRPAPLHATSSGKALLAWLPPHEVDLLLSGPLVRYTDTTIVDRDRLLEELEATRRHGYGVCAGELEPTLFGISAPVLDASGRPFAVVSIWGPSDRVTVERFDGLGAEARRGAAEVASAVLTGPITH